jgi:hypothetical protein
VTVATSFEVRGIGCVRDATKSHVTYLGCAARDAHNTTPLASVRLHPTASIDAEGGTAVNNALDQHDGDPVTPDRIPAALIADEFFYDDDGATQTLSPSGITTYIEAGQPTDGE